MSLKHGTREPPPRYIGGMPLMFWLWLLRPAPAQVPAKHFAQAPAIMQEARADATKWPQAAQVALAAMIARGEAWAPDGFEPKVGADWQRAFDMAVRMRAAPGERRLNSARDVKAKVEAEAVDYFRKGVIEGDVETATLTKMTSQMDAFSGDSYPAARFWNDMPAPASVGAAMGVSDARLRFEGLLVLALDSAPNVDQSGKPAIAGQAFDAALGLLQRHPQFWSGELPQIAWLGWVAARIGKPSMAQQLGTMVLRRAMPILEASGVPHDSASLVAMCRPRDDATEIEVQRNAAGTAVDAVAMVGKYEFTLALGDVQASGSVLKPVLLVWMGIDSYGERGD